MRIAVLADIHGNVLALEAVMADLRELSPDLVVNLGDHVSGPLEARRTADFLMSQRDWVQIRGNHDRQLIEHSREEMGLSDGAAISELTHEHLAWLRALPPSAVVEGISLVHGTPFSDLEYLLEDVPASGTVCLAPGHCVRGRLGDMTGLVLCGHTHIPRLVQVDPKTTVLNPGSVGLQAYVDDTPYPHVVEVGSPHARYAVLDGVRDGWRATFRTVEYDWEIPTRQAQQRNRLDWAQALRTGYVRQA
jgi:predicted phosphodiesterase